MSIFGFTLQSNAAHVFSGISECALALFLFFYGYDQFVGEFSQGIARAMAAEVTRNDISQAQIGAMGVLGYVLYLLLRPFRALWIFDPNPGLAPWAVLPRPFRAGNGFRDRN